jgi:hypothetical protein
MMISKGKLPDGFDYPAGYQRIVELNLINLEPWYILPSERAEKIMVGLRERYYKRVLIPFAKRDDNDDISCFEIGGSYSIVIIHDFSSAGTETRKGYNNIWDWFRDAIEEMIEF